MIAGRAGQSISNAAALLVCSWSAVLTKRGLRNEKVVSQQQCHGQASFTDACGEQRLASVVQSNKRATAAQTDEMLMLVLTEWCHVHHLAAEQMVPGCKDHPHAVIAMWVCLVCNNVLVVVRFRSASTYMPESRFPKEFHIMTRSSVTSYAS